MQDMATTNAILEEENDDDEILKNSNREKEQTNFNATIDWFSTKSPSNKKRTQDFINSDFMKFEENQARIDPKDKFQSRMAWRTLRSK